MKNWQRIFTSIVGTALVLAVSGGVVAALAVPAAPNQTAVLDQANVIDDTTEVQISQQLIDYKAKTGNEIAVLTVKTLGGEDFFTYSQEVFQAWGIGNKTANNGALLIVAVDDHKVRIHTGRGLEPYLTDLQSSLIITQKITPEFKKGNYGAGIAAGVNGMIAVIGGERLSASSTKATSSSPAWLSWVPYLIFPIIYIPAFLARSKSWWAGGVIGVVPGGFVMMRSLLGGAVLLAGGAAFGLLLDYLLSKNYRARTGNGLSTTWWGSGGGFFGGGSSSGGGFGGFGGGSSGGGGASGSW